SCSRPRGFLRSCRRRSMHAPPSCTAAASFQSRGISSRSGSMITVNVLYPNQDGAKFDMNYYLTSHIPMVKRVLGSALKGCVVEQGLGGGAPGEKAEYSTL